MFLSVPYASSPLATSQSAADGCRLPPAEIYSVWNTTIGGQSYDSRTDLIIRNLLYFTSRIFDLGLGARLNRALSDQSYTHDLASDSGDPKRQILGGESYEYLTSSMVVLLVPAP